MKPTLHRIVCEAKVNSIYVCRCGNRGVGTTGRYMIDAYGLMDAKEQLDAIQQLSYDMPVGWSYSGKYHCPECNNKNS